MMRPEQIPPKDCGNFLADLPKYLGLEETALQREQIYPHYRSCERCRQNLGTAREMAGAFTGLKPRISASIAAKVSVGSRMQTIETAVQMALRSNRTELSQTFTDLGKALYVEALQLNQDWDPHWVDIGRLREVSDYRKLGMDLANDSLLFCRKNDERNAWVESQEEMAQSPDRGTWKSCLDESLRYLVVARKLNPANEDATIAIAQNYYLREDSVSAMEALTRVIQDNNQLRRLVQAHNNLGNYLFEGGRFAEGIEHSKRARQLDPEEPTVAYNFAQYMLLSEDRDSAWKAFGAVEEDPRFIKRAAELVNGHCRKRLASHFRSFPKDLERLEKEFPKTFAPETVRRIREEVQS